MLFLERKPTEDKMRTSRLIIVLYQSYLDKKAYARTVETVTGVPDESRLRWVLRWYRYLVMLVNVLLQN